MTSIADSDRPTAADMATRLVAARRALALHASQLVERVESCRRSQRFAYCSNAGDVVLRLVVDPPNLLLHFMQGASLPDPGGLLMGRGRWGRYLCLRTVALVDDPVFVTLIAQAIARAPRL
jgi:hypothetical protein